MDRDQRRRQVGCLTPREASFDRRMIGAMDRIEPALALFIAQGAVGLDLPAFAFGDDEARDVGCAIAVDDEAGDVGPDQRRIELGRQKPRHGERAGVPGDMRLQRIFFEAERGVVRRDAIGGVIADDYDRSDTIRILNHDRLESPVAHPLPHLPGPSGRASCKMARRDILDCCVRTSRTAGGRQLQL